jgi:hypothetical protein
MSEAVIVSTARTPIATSRRGTLAETSAFDLATAITPVLAAIWRHRAYHQN